MAADDDIKAIQEVVQLLKTEPSNVPGPSLCQPDMPSLREELAILVCTGKSKKAINVQLTHQEVKRLPPKDVEKYYKRCETYVGAKTTETLGNSFISVYTKGGLKMLKLCRRISKELSTLVGSLALRCGRLLMVANTALITRKQIDFSRSVHTEQAAVDNQHPA